MSIFLRKWKHAVLIVVLSVYTAYAAGPLFWVSMMSLRTTSEIAHAPYAFPQKFHVGKFADLDTAHFVFNIHQISGVQSHRLDRNREHDRFVRGKRLRAPVRRDTSDRTLQSPEGVLPHERSVRANRKSSATHRK